MKRLLADLIYEAGFIGVTAVSKADDEFIRREIEREKREASR